MNNKMPEEVKEEILTWCRKQKYSKEEILEYANKLRAVKISRKSIRNKISQE